MGIYTGLLRPLLFCFDAERVHDWAIRSGAFWGRFGVARAAISGIYGFEDSRLETEVCGIKFRNPVGLAAGYDKNGRAVAMMAAMGFSHVEIGSVSADVSYGNPKPRLFRLPADRAVVVHYGLPNEGAAAVAAQLGETRLPAPLGVNIVKTNRGIDAPPDSDEAITADYVYSVRTLKDVGDYLSLNLSCPNTEMGRDFFAEKANVVRLMTALSDLDIRCPVFLKVSPLGGVAAIERLLEAVEGVAFVSGFVYNLAPGKPESLVTRREIVDKMPGAVAGKPVEDQMNTCIRELYRRMDRERYRIIGIGGVFSAEDAYRKIRLGASLVQILTALVYEGPGVVKQIKQGLCRLLERDGFANVTEAVGADNTP